MSNGEAVRTRFDELGQQRATPQSNTKAAFGSQELNGRIDLGMKEVEQLLHTELTDGPDFLMSKISYLSNAGGKRFRPMFALLASEYGPHAQSENVVKSAVVVEMTHLATLYHDDVMDEATMRRGVPSANVKWNNSIAILAGDVLLAKVSKLMNDMGETTVANFAETFGELVTGQMRETVGPGDGDPIEHYLNVIHEKTGVLIASAGYLGALHSGAEPAHSEALRKFGSAIGSVFQIVDDIIDIFSNPEDSGKTPGTDLREGVFTLPVLYAMQEDSPAGAELRELLTGPIHNEATVSHVLDLLKQSGGRDRALADVQHLVDVAIGELAELPDNDATAALRELATSSVQRIR